MKARGEALPVLERLQREQAATNTALASPERQRDQVRSRKMAATVLVLLVLTPLGLYFSGRSFNRPPHELELHRDLLLRDALLEASPAFDRCYRGAVATRATLHVAVDQAGRVTRIATDDGEVDTACVYGELRGVRAPPSQRPTVTSLEVVLFPRR